MLDPESSDLQWTRLASRLDKSHWVSGPPALIVDYLRLPRLQSGQWTTIGNHQRLQRRVNAWMDYHLRPHRLQSVQWTMRTNYLRFHCAANGNKHASWIKGHSITWFSGGDRHLSATGLHRLTAAVEQQDNLVGPQRPR